MKCCGERQKLTAGSAGNTLVVGTVSLMMGKALCRLNGLYTLSQIIIIHGQLCTVHCFRNAL